MPLSRLQGLFQELRRRHVVKVGVVYAGTAFVVLQAAGLVFPSLAVPAWAFDLMVVLVLFGFPVTLVMAWAFEITPEGVRRTPPIRTLEEELAEESTGGLLRRLASLVGRDGEEGSDRFRQAPAAGDVGPGHGEDGGERGELRRASMAKLRHDLRSPINAIVGYAEMLAEEEAERTDPDRETMDDLGRIRKAGRELQRVVDGVLRPDGLPGTSGSGPAASPDAVGQDLHHRLRTPLNAVVGYAELLLERHEEMGRVELREDVGRILKAAGDMLERSDEIIRFCVAEAAGEATPEDYARVSGIARRAMSRIRTAELPGPDAGNGHAGALLVVDDEERNRELYSRRLALQGYTVSTASDGEEALERMRGQEYDLVLLDLLMPGMDGAEVLRRMQADDDLAALPVIVVSGLDEMDVAVRCLRSGAADFLAKPFDPSLLAVRVEAAIRARRIQDEARRHRRRVRVQEELLQRVLFAGFPDAVAERVRAGETEFVDRFPEATVLSARVVGLPGRLSRGDPLDGLRTLARLRGWMEALGAEGDVGVLSFRDFHLLAAAGVPASREDHPRILVRFALALLERRSEAEAVVGGAFRFRMGAHTGPVIAGVGGEEGRMVYDLWGEGVEVADGLEASAPLDALHVSSALRARLGEDQPAESRGVVEVADRGRMRTFTLRPAVVESAREGV